MQINWANLFPVQILQCPQFELSWLMKAVIIVQNKRIKGKQCMSTQVGFKQQRSTLHLMTNAQAPYLSEGYIPALIICKWPSWKVEEGHSLSRGHREDEPCRREGVRCYFLQSLQWLCEGTTSLSDSALLFQLPHFYDSGPCKST